MSEPWLPRSLCGATESFLHLYFRRAVQHAALVGWSQARAPEVESHPLRAAFALALDNVAEGCVRESFGAMVATYQAAHACDPDVRAVMADVARDETRHAALAFALRTWLESQLGARATRGGGACA